MSEKITFKQLYTIATDVVKTVPYPDNSIVIVCFTYQGARWSAQYDERSAGLYAFTLETPQRFFFPPVKPLDLEEKLDDIS